MRKPLDKVSKHDPEPDNGKASTLMIVIHEASYAIGHGQLERRRVKVEG